MKKLLTLVLALAMTLSLAACGGDTTTTDDGSGETGSGEPTKMTLILRGGAYGESLQAMLEPFAEEHNVEFEVLLQEFDALHTGIALDAVNETGTYDLCMVDGSWMAEFTENGVHHAQVIGALGIDGIHGDAGIQVGLLQLLHLALDIVLGLEGGEALLDDVGIGAAAQDQRQLGGVAGALAAGPFFRVSAAAAGSQGHRHAKGQEQCKQFLHFHFLLVSFLSRYEFS